MKRSLGLLFAVVLLIVGTRLKAQCSSVWQPNGTTLTTTCSQVGIGTATPSPYAQLHIYGASTSDVFAGFGPDLQSGPAMTLGYAGSWARSIGFFNVRPDSQADAPNPSLRFMTANVQRMMIDNTGVVRILDVNGNWLTPNSGDRLTVNGTIRGTNVVATYQDVAEWVPVTEAIPSGTVVIVDERPNTVAPSTQPYDTRVAGVISLQPGIILGVEGPSKAKVATTGRVKVRVDATHHSVHVGDLLVTGDRPGLAMVSEPIVVGGVKIHRPGTLIGKALEPLDRGEGEILVLLSLQ